MVLWAVVRDRQTREVQASFDRAAENTITHLERVVRDNRFLLDTVRRFYVGSHGVNRFDFKAFVKPLVNDCREIGAVAWVPRIVDDRRAECVAATSRDGLVNFQITQPDNHGRLRQAERRDEYFPIYFAEPWGDNPNRLGVDLGTDPACLEAWCLASVWC